MRRADVQARFVELWREATHGRSYIVWTVPVLGPAGAAGYLAKYMLKGALYRQTIEEAGFKRRWSCSRAWPSPERMRMRGSDLGSWEKVEFTYKLSEFWTPLVEKMRKEEELLEQVGDDMAIALGARKKLKGFMKNIERLEQT